RWAAPCAVRSADGLLEEAAGPGARFSLPCLPRAHHAAGVRALPRAGRRACLIWGAPKWPPKLLGSNRRGLGQPGATDVRLDVADDVVLHDDLGLVVLDVPVRDRGE